MYISELVIGIFIGVLATISALIIMSLYIGTKKKDGDKDAKKGEE